MNTDLVTLIRLIDIALTSLQLSAEAMARWGKRREEIKTIVAEGRNPTEAEWAGILASAVANNKAIEDA